MQTRLSSKRFSQIQFLLLAMLRRISCNLFFRDFGRDSEFDSSSNLIESWERKDVRKHAHCSVWYFEIRPNWFVKKKSTFSSIWQIPTIWLFKCLPAFGISPLRDKGRHLAWTNAYENDQIVKIQCQIWEGKWTLKMRKHL